MRHSLLSHIRQVLCLAIAVLFGATVTFGDAYARTYKRNYKQFTVMAYGDSFTSGYGIEKDDAYPTRLRYHVNRMWDNYRIDVINAGITGDTAASGASRISTILEEKPDIVIVAFGMTDALKGIDPVITYRALEQMLSVLTYNNIYVIMVGFKAPESMPLAKATQFNKMFPELAARYKVSFYPYLLNGVEGEWYNLQYDGIFPNEDGHEHIGEELAFVLSKMIRKIRSRPENFIERDLEGNFMR
ncbi:MAG: GDSL-type esterase/lipase family protein [Rickettsiales bacterium]|nr:GDSL-type esterase/lipase family protein [Rickettsiales bacterium]